MNWHAPIAEALAEVASMSVEEAARIVRDQVDPDDLAISERFATRPEVGGWENFAKNYSSLVARAEWEEHYGRLPERLKTTMIGHSIVCRSHGHTLHLTRLM
jgi:hypothetical protein